MSLPSFPVDFILIYVDVLLLYNRNPFLLCLHSILPLSYLLPPFTAVKSIKKQHLVEVRSMPTPPAAVKQALESICLLLGENAQDWKQIRSVIVRENFIGTIVNFETDNIR